ncbi:Caffeine resistance protein 5 [Emericellopsis cladophorae]|uniref:Caffeine resistance protein 5 n=1 Tax=Emericellopsis cladophorae TaxID=2686198 RepID=A0A9P9Y1G5_9HYPO|nr:Caffeine resistance protein 5 [Emericellopsis cladophorae]KAI6781418.1 Caffeine resistance protein 5 [Emericellopsis cladophorae]
MFLFFLPEMSTHNPLLCRAERLRKLTGNQRFMSQSEIDQRTMRFRHDPAMLFVQIYVAIIYGIYYSFFEVFPLVYIPLSYPQYPASLFAGNDFYRSALAAGSILFAEPLPNKLGVATKGTN